MNILKRNVSLILSVILLALAIFPLTASIASTNSENVSMSVLFNNKEMEYAGVYEVTGGETIKVSATSKNAPIAFIAYYYNNENDSKEQQEANYKARTKVNSSSVTITVPTGSVGTTRVLWIEAVDSKDNGSENVVNKTGWQGYYLKYVDKSNTTPSNPINGEVNAKYNKVVLVNGSTTKVDPARTLELSATHADKLKKIYFKWDGGQLKEVTTSPYNLMIPTEFAKGTTHKLDLVALYNNGEYSAKKLYYITIPAEGDNDVTNPDDKELDVLPWEEVSKDLDRLAISLRNDSESEKANKNVYSLEEKVTYYVDFKNGGKDIDNEVVMTLKLPLDFVVIDSDNGLVNAEARTITWGYPNGMKEGQEGTKTVVVKYISLGKNDAKTIYPLATISKNGKVVDDSAVINYVYKDNETVITDTHVPYMYGDANATTFRPDATITRAEGALVLTRILLGQSAIDNVTVTSVYPDLDQTYLEAQKAIIAATKYGIINGYTDGYYRPNQIMTRAEFMKIIAKFVELDAENDRNDGLQIKELDELIKLYEDPQRRYAVNGQIITDHWAIEEVTLLARLNMTPVNSDDKDLRLDEGITRAEVAQLVNFYLLRAPAEITNRTTVEFSDVIRRHKLFADIVEATRDSHNYTITEDGTEIAK